MLAFLCCLFVGAFGLSDGVEAQEPPVVGVRGGEHPDFSRIVFDWPAPVAYELKVTGHRIVITFAASGVIDASGVGRSGLSRIGEIRIGGTPDLPIVEIAIGDNAAVDHFTLDKRVVIDVRGTAPPGELPPPSDLNAPESAIMEAVPPVAPAIVLEAGAALPVAAFRRDGRFYLVVPGTRPEALAFIEEAREAIPGALPLAVSDGVGIWTPAYADARPVLVRVEDGWRILTVDEGSPPPSLPRAVKVNGTGDRLVVDAGPNATVAAFVDPVVGDRLMVVGLDRPVLCNLRRRFIPFELLETMQGLAVLPHFNGTRIEIEEDRVVIATDGLTEWIDTAQPK